MSLETEMRELALKKHYRPAPVVDIKLHLERIKRAAENGNCQVHVCKLNDKEKSALEELGFSCSYGNDNMRGEHHMIEW